MGKLTKGSNITQADEAEALRQTAASERDAFYINIAIAMLLISTLIYAVLESK